VEKELKKSQKVTAQEVKILLLGSGASGKSTVAKQMKLLYLDGFSDKEASIFTDIIFFNIIKNMKTLVMQAEKFGFVLEPQNKGPAEELKNMTIQLSDVELTTEVRRYFCLCWGLTHLCLARQRHCESVARSRNHADD
jgi:guanine nucleotide-binding protein G(i) subunit alpha